MNKKRIAIVILVIVIALSVSGIIYYFTKQDENTLTLSEKNWIQNNKNNLIDLSIPSETPILGNSGSGLIFDFLEDLEKDTGLEFNKLSYDQNEKSTSSYAITTKDKVSSNDILIYQDNYALITQTKIKYSNLSQINNITIGILKNEEKNINKYLNNIGTVTYKTYENTGDMLKDVADAKIDACIAPRLEYLNEIIANDNLNIAYNLNDYTKDYVLKLGTTKKLNKILNKYYTKWQSDSFEVSLGKNIVSTYFKAQSTSEQAQVKFRSKVYNYGFIQNAPFDISTSNGLKGFNHSLLNSFAKAADIDLSYKKYSNINSLTTDFSENKLDIIFNYQYQKKYNMDTYETVAPYNGTIAIISSQDTNSWNTISSLKNQTVITIKDSQIDNYLKENKIKTKTYNNIKDLISNLNKNDLVAIDYNSYDYYVRNNLNSYRLLGTLTLDDGYNLITRDISANKTFNELFDFYLSFTNVDKTISESYKELLEYNHNTKTLQLLLIIFTAILLVLIGVLLGRFIKYRKSKNRKLTKTDKLRYIDTLTSLKNRNYLNDNIDTWDSSDIYPQTIIIIDLNNVAYINDNFGHAEGDKVIVEGAGVLIANQLSDSEIIRTNGNEFLIFMVGHDEKTVISYIRKLHKEFKNNVSHGFGAAIGYSMITDDIKTFDDAVNEATSDMRNNKEDK